jgi:hypothetical protein
MNEQIKELALQAGIRFPNNLVEGVNGPGIVTEKDKLAKFAGLIVKECADIAMREDHDPADCIKKHFGVAE